MRIKTRMLWVLVAALASFFVIHVPAANADTIQYTVTGSGQDAGTNFTFVSTSGFLTASSFPIVPTTATDLFVGGVDEGAISSVAAINSDSELEIIAADDTFVFVAAKQGGILFPTATGTFTDKVNGVVTGTVVVTDISAVPEPGSIILMLTGLGSLGFMMLKRTPYARGLL